MNQQTRNRITEIGEAVDFIVSEVSEKPQQSCFLYAVLGAIALNRYVPEYSWLPNFGHWAIVIGEDDEGRINLEYDPNQHPDEFHAWIIGLPVKSAGDDDYCIVDMAARHYESLVHHPLHQGLKPTLFYCLPRTLCLHFSEFQGFGLQVAKAHKELSDRLMASLQEPDMIAAFRTITPTLYSLIDRMDIEMDAIEKTLAS